MSDYEYNAAYVIAKQVKGIHQRELEEAGRLLREIPGVGSGPMGLTPDSVKFSPEYRGAKRRYDEAFRTLRNFNKHFVKTYRKEITKEKRSCLRPYILWNWTGTPGPSLSISRLVSLLCR